jgi:dihydroorotase
MKASAPGETAGRGFFSSTIRGVAPILIRGGRVVDPASGLDGTADVLIIGRLIAAIGRVDPPRGARVIDAGGCIVAPGLIDPHVHFRDPHPPGQHQERLATGAAAAIAGGFTTVCCMPNTEPPIDSPATLEHIRREAERAGRCRVVAAACATAGRRGEAAGDLEGLARAGAVAFTDDGDCVADAAVMLEVLHRARAADRAFMQHCQEPALTRGASMNAGAVADQLGLRGWPAVAEEIIIERDVRLNLAAGCRYHVQHISSGGSVGIVRRVRAAGQPVTAEASPHHLLLTDEACATHGTLAKMNPPLRTRGDIDEIKRGIADGTITVLATDHAPHPMERKALPFAQAPFGIVGLDCALPLYARALVDDGVIDWPRLVAMMTIEPARLLGLEESGRGRLAVGGEADVTVIDPDEEWVIDPSAFASEGRNCPFAGWKVKGRATTVVVAGSLMRSPAARDGR